MWGEREDWRKPLSRAETNGLRAKVDQLEELTKHYREQIESLQAQVHSHRRDGQASSSGPPSGAAFQSVNSGVTGIGATTASDPPSVGTDGRPRRPSAKATLHDPQEDVDGMVVSCSLQESSLTPRSKTPEVKSGSITPVRRSGTPCATRCLMRRRVPRPSRAHSSLRRG